MTRIRNNKIGTNALGQGALPNDEHGINLSQALGTTVWDNKIVHRANKDGLMSADELAAMQLAEMTERAHAMAAKMITRMDSDGDGLLSAAEMAVRPGPARFFDRIDTDGDGAISREEADAAADKMADRRGGDRRPMHGDDKPAN